MLQIWFAFVAGLAGGFHCIGMCGGVAAALSLKGCNAPLRPRLASQLCYNSGRILTYTLLGATAGLVGSSLDLVTLKSVSHWFLVGANIFVTTIGAATALGLGRLGISALDGRGARFLATPLRRAAATTSPLAALPLGMLLGLIPCGLVYAPLISAAASGSLILGAATMASLGLGTIPALLLFGTASSALSGWMRNGMQRVAGVAVSLMGAAGIWRALA